MTYGLSLAVEAMAISDIAGTSGIQTQAYSTSVLQTLRKSVTKLEPNGHPPATFILHPNDWEAIELALLSTSAVEFQGLPFDAQRRTLWSLAGDGDDRSDCRRGSHPRVGGGRTQYRFTGCADCVGAKRPTPTTGRRT